MAGSGADSSATSRCRCCVPHGECLCPAGTTASFGVHCSPPVVHKIECNQPHAAIAANDARGKQGSAREEAGGHAHGHQTPPQARWQGVAPRGPDAAHVSVIVSIIVITGIIIINTAVGWNDITVLSSLLLPSFVTSQLQYYSYDSCDHYIVVLFQRYRDSPEVSARWVPPQNSTL